MVPAASNEGAAVRTACLLFPVWLVLLPVLPAAASQPMRVVCSLDRPVVGTGEMVGAAAFAEAPAGTALRYRWRATGGTFVPPADRPKVAWEAKAPGRYALSANVTDPSGAVAGCTLMVVVVTQVQRSAPAASRSELGSEAERDMLVRGSQEDAGYGLYSYILLAARPDESNMERYRAVLAGYLRLEDIRLGAYFSDSQLNVTYVPVDRDPAPSLNVQWVLDHYDYERSRFLLGRLHDRDLDLGGDGPFIVSGLHPLGEAGSAGPFISQNLSTVPLSVIPLWMQAFRSQTTQQRVWQRRTIGTIALNLRTVIAVAAEGLPMAEKAVSEWIRF